MSIDKIDFIDAKSIGIFLYYYEHDLNIISKFQDYKRDKNHTFLKFFILYLNEYKVARNFIKNQAQTLLNLTLDWISGDTPDDVYGFSEYLKNNKITHEKKAISLSSKILMLNNSAVIFPIDGLVKKHFKIYYKKKIEDNYYENYLLRVRTFENEHRIEIEAQLNILKIYTDSIEKKYLIINIEQVRKNRFLDKILWTSGKYTKN